LNVRGSKSAAAIVLLALLDACAPHVNDPRAIADRITRAVYANDITATTADFDDETKKTVTRSQLGDLSDKMHALGDYRSLTQRSADADTGKYAYDAHFANGAMLVELRIDPSGKVGAYRVSPEQHR
jgi:CO/xanthine dehydrogenase Mo-binding subunit